MWSPPSRRWDRLLHRAGPDLNAVKFVKAALVVQYRLAPGLEDHFQIFPETVAQLIERNSKSQGLPLHEAMADPKLESASAQTVEGGIILGNPKRVVVRQQDHRSANPNPGRPLRNSGADDRSSRKEPAEGMKVVFRKPDRIEAELFCVPRLLYDTPASARSRLPEWREAMTASKTTRNAWPEL